MAGNCLNENNTKFHTVWVVYLFAIDKDSANIGKSKQKIFIINLFSLDIYRIPWDFYPKCLILPNY